MYTRKNTGLSTIYPQNVDKVFEIHILWMNCAHQILEKNILKTHIL